MGSVELLLERACSSEDSFPSDAQLNDIQFVALLSMLVSLGTCLWEFKVMAGKTQGLI